MDTGRERKYQEVTYEELLDKLKTYITKSLMMLINLLGNIIRARSVRVEMIILVIPLMLPIF